VIEVYAHQVTEHVFGNVFLVNSLMAQAANPVPIVHLPSVIIGMDVWMAIIVVYVMTLNVYLVMTSALMLVTLVLKKTLSLTTWVTTFLVHVHLITTTREIPTPVISAILTVLNA
jgi:hypothetical protein